MDLVTGKLYAARYRLQLLSPLVVGRAHLYQREGYALRYERNGSTGYGDLCPLPGRSRETLGESAELLRQGREKALPPSASWAMATARRPAQPLAAPAIASATLVPSLADPTPGAQRALKLKVGRAPLEAECDWVRSVARSCDAALRLDANRNLDLDGAHLLAQAAGRNLDFLEEPVPDDQLDQALRALPLALDETLEAGRTPHGAVAWVLKPTLLGLERTVSLVRSAQKQGLRVILSSAYESALGRTALARYAATVAADEVHGLATGGAFTEDLANAATLSWTRWR